MGRIAFLDDGLPFDGLAADARAMGGAESSVVSLAEAFVARGHEVVVYNRCAASVSHRGVAYRPISEAAQADATHFIVNRSAELLPLAPEKASKTLWVHNDARYLRKWRHAWPMWRFRPSCVVLSDYHAKTLGSAVSRGKKHTIPLGVDDWFRSNAPTPPPPPRAVFASNPERGLRELLDLWVNRIHPVVPEAELHLFTRAAFYGVASKSALRAEPTIAYARTLEDKHIHLHEMVPRRTLAAMYASMRVMLYWGDETHAETFCLSVAEARAAGVPCVARPIGAVEERIKHGSTGFLEQDPDRFAAAAISLMTDDQVWREHHERCTGAPPMDWNIAASRFEALHA